MFFPVGLIKISLTLKLGLKALRRFWLMLKSNVKKIQLSFCRGEEINRKT